MCAHSNQAITVVSFNEASLWQDLQVSKRDHVDRCGVASGLLRVNENELIRLENLLRRQCRARLQVLKLFSEYEEKCVESRQMSKSLPMCVCVGVLYV